MRWWGCGLTGGVVLSATTAFNAVHALIRGIDGPVAWGEAPGVLVATFAMGFLCGVIAWSGRGLHRRFVAAGDAVVGMAVMLAFFVCCMLLYAPELLGAKLRDGGLAMLGMAMLMGAFAGIWFGRDLDDKPSSPGA